MTITLNGLAGSTRRSGARRTGNSAPGLISPAHGITDSLPLSIVAEAIGRRTPVVVAISVNAPLWRHPQARQSAATLRAWGCVVLDPVQEGETTTLAPDAALLAAVRPFFQVG